MAALSQSSSYLASACLGGVGPLVLWGRGKSNLYVQLSNEGSSSQTHDGVNGITYSDIPKWKLLNTNATIYTALVWV